MKVISLQELRNYVEGIQKSLNVVVGFLAESDAIIADIPAPEKKIRKKRVKKEKRIPLISPPSTIDKTQTGPWQRGRGKGKKVKHPFYGPEEKVDTPVEPS